MNTVHTAWILQSPPDHAIFHERGQPLSVAALGHSQAAGETPRTAARSGDKISVVLVWQPKP